MSLTRPFIATQNSKLKTSDSGALDRLQLLHRRIDAYVGFLKAFDVAGHNPDRADVTRRFVKNSVLKVGKIENQGVGEDG